MSENEEWDKTIQLTFMLTFTGDDAVDNYTSNNTISENIFPDPFYDKTNISYLFLKLLM